MKVRPTSIKQLALNSGMPEEIVTRFLDELVNMAFAVALRERKHCYKQIRAWVHSGDIIKPDVQDVLKISAEDETYDIL